MSYEQSTKNITKDLPTMVGYYARLLQVSKGDCGYMPLVKACEDFLKNKNYTAFLREIKKIKENRNV